MKKTVLLLAFLLCTIYGFSQNALYGVRAGYNISNLDFDPDPTGFANKHRNGFAIGFFGEYSLSNSLAIAPEIQFSAEGANDEGIKIDYLQMPIVFKYKIGDRFAIGVGPQASLKTHDYEDGLKNFAFSGIGGIEYMLSDEFFLDFRYSYGLTNIFDDETELDAINTNMQIGFGLKF
ncbi:porin family protein [Lacinutrix sp. 5H-3-7-4]|uniref:porin family protein n=1 Tax=Lacinutrix sp. (strain 5H-3-7-4) TaxID=983544 RepID=UPI00020A3CDF|nr:porin family protein [Lacinutrix sp. 5H-3-7-4]AEH02488.1 hypothetical protein Lacal_2648 [Lacinutrix sp. 5H-3-7-4]